MESGKRAKRMVNVKAQFSTAQLAQEMVDALVYAAVQARANPRP
jgi:hypothetical protein